MIENYKDFVARDVAKMFLIGLEALEIDQLFALTGGSLGGGIAWEMAGLKPDFTEHLIPVATDWKSTDWLIANCQIQEQLLPSTKFTSMGMSCVCFRPQPPRWVQNSQMGA